MEAQIRTCENCGREIGKLEADTYEGRPVCKPCLRRLADSDREPSGGRVIQGYMRAFWGFVAVLAAIKAANFAARGAAAPVLVWTCAVILFLIGIGMIWLALSTSRPRKRRVAGAAPPAKTTPEAIKFEYVCGACGYRATVEPSNRCPRCKGKWDRARP